MCGLVSSIALHPRQEGILIATTVDVFTTERSYNSSNPLTSSMFLLEHTENDEPAPKYDYDETGIVIKG